MTASSTSMIGGFVAPLHCVAVERGRKSLDAGVVVHDETGGESRVCRGGRRCDENTDGPGRGKSPNL